MAFPKALAAPPKSLAEMTAEVCEWTKRKGWWDDGRTFGDIIALAHSELSEALEEHRDGHMNLYYKCTTCGKVVDEVDNENRHAMPNPHSWPEETKFCTGTFKPEGASVEFADLFIRMLHTCAHYGWDLEELYELKMAYNEKRPFRHGGKVL